MPRDMEGSVKDVAFGEKWSVVPRVAKEAKPSGMQMKEEMVLNVDGRPKGTPCVATSDFGEGSALFLSRKPMVFVGVLVLCYRHTDHQARVGSFFTLRLQVVFHTTTGTTAMVTCVCAALSPGMSRACTSTTPICPLSPRLQRPWWVPCIAWMAGVVPLAWIGWMVGMGVDWTGVNICNERVDVVCAWRWRARR